jgi:Trk K+ transport system NAD-binding subunit
VSQASTHREQSRPARAIVAGYGPVGRAVTEELEQSGLAVTIVEANPETVRRQCDLGRTAFYGNAADPGVLLAAGVQEADALILTIPDEEAAMEACKEARRLVPKIFIAVRTNHVSNAMRATQAGADHVTIEEVVTAHAMQQAVTHHLASRKDRPLL